MPSKHASTWHTATAVVSGVRHRRNQAACQDVLRTAVVDRKWLLVALADGAGSAPLGGLGADLATRSALGALATHCADRQARTQPVDTETAIRKGFAEARGVLEREAAGRAVTLRDLATTLLVCLATPDWIVAGQVGDGAVVLGEGEGAWRTLTRPASGEYLNETVFVTSEDALDRMQVAPHEGAVRELALFSDGLQMLALKLADAAPHEPFFRPLFSWLSRTTDPFTTGRELESLLRSPRVADRTDDDLSLCLARWTG
ncbi:MAG: protein phosphatase 2C domain-containing protein [Verrucomicrobiae bacterium]|nr:protein phosphatase 2C domain-containing protein [Verrucomicrobiae bacterium]MCP5521052.1 protein phosphatase 2C domain-containing protein [Verrucomicrobiales bacterium]